MVSMSKELLEIRSILDGYLQNNCTLSKTLDSPILQSDIKALQQKEADRCMAEQMKSQITGLKVYQYKEQNC